MEHEGERFRLDPDVPTGIECRAVHELNQLCGDGSDFLTRRQSLGHETDADLRRFDEGIRARAEESSRPAKPRICEPGHGDPRADCRRRFSSPQKTWGNTFRAVMGGPNPVRARDVGQPMDLRLQTEKNREDKRMKYSLIRQGLVGLVSLGVLLLFSTTATAASDGALGLNSIGSTVVSIVKGDTAQITGMADIVLVPWSTGQPAPVGSTTACVFASTGLYSMTATSANPSGAIFRMTDGLAFIDYTVGWNDGVAGLQAVSNGAALLGLVGDALSLTCGGATPATVQVDITVANMNGAPTGAFSDTLTIIIAPL